MTKKKCIIVCIILTIIMFLSNIGNTYSASVDVLKQEKNDLQSKLNAAKKEIDNISSEMTEVQKQVSELNAQISIYQEEIDNLQVQIKENEAKIVQLQAEFEKRKEALAKRIVAQYEEGDISYLDYLLSSESLADFISSYYVICELANMDKDMLTAIENTKKEIEQTKQQLEQDKANVQEQTNILKTKKNEREVYRNQLKKQKTDLEAKEEQFEKEIKDVQNKIDEAVRAANAVYQGSFSGTLSWPLSSSSRYYNLITSGFGMRNQPVAGASVNHRAVDIGVSFQPIYAAADGYIVIAESGYGGYGNFIMIKHSNNLYTCYGHISQFKVSVGQTVKRGQQIAVSGNTGVSSGPHLHFEVRTNASYGSRVNPLDYIGSDIYSKLIFAF